MDLDPWVNSNYIVQHLKYVYGDHIDRKVREIGVAGCVVVSVRFRREVCGAYWHSEIGEACTQTTAFGRVEKIVQQVSVSGRVIRLGRKRMDDGRRFG